MSEKQAEKVAKGKSPRRGATLIEESPPRWNNSSAIGIGRDFTQKL